MKYEFDKYGNYVKKQIKATSTIKKENPKNIIRLKSFEKILSIWKYFGKDTRFHITAISGCFVCFGIIFYTGLALENRISNIELKSTIQKDTLDKNLWNQHVQNLYGLQYDPIKHLVMF